jgi:mRNA interferase RelE/StbE
VAECGLLIKPSAARFRVRQGHYRVTYVVDDAHRTIEVIKVGHRREVYRSAP